MLIFFCILTLVIYVISVHIPLRIDVFFDLESGKVAFSLAIFFITVFKTRKIIENRALTEGELVLKSRADTKKSVDKVSILELVRMIREFNFALIGNLDVIKIHLKLEYGTGDAFKTFAQLALIRMSFYSVISALKTRQNLEVDEMFVPHFNVRTINGNFFGIFKLSVADIMYGFMLGKYRKNKRKAAKVPIDAQNVAA